MLFCIKWLSGMQEFSVLFSVRLAVWYAGRYHVVYYQNDCLVCRNIMTVLCAEKSCCLVSE